MVPPVAARHKHLRMPKTVCVEFYGSFLCHIVKAETCLRHLTEGAILERRPYFLLGDILACTATGAAAAWVTHALLPGGWIILAGMITGMVLGMMIGVVAGLVFQPIFGALEVALPAGLAGMAGGVAGGMLRVTVDLDVWAVLWSGALAGLASLAYSYIQQWRLHGAMK